MNSKKVSEFGKLLSHSSLLDYLNSVGFSRPTQVQSDAIPALLATDNISLQGKTGSGKTLAYLLPLFQKIKNLEAANRSNESDKAACPKAVILLPTRELATQVFHTAKSISHFVKLRVRKMVGGDKGKSLDTLFASPMDILITTPERCSRSFKNGELKTPALSFLILDEADQLLENSFKQSMGELITFLNLENVQTILVSASRPASFDEILNDYFPNKKFLTIGRGEENVLNHKVETFNIAIDENDKFFYLSSFLKKQGKRNGLIFVGNKARASKVFADLNALNMPKIFLLHKDFEIKERALIVEKFRTRGGIMVTTDIFARGIDIPHLEWVLNFDLPSEPDYYLHRSGRVGRAGRSGSVFNFITSRDNDRQLKINETLVRQGRLDLHIIHRLRT